MAGTITTDLVDIDLAEATTNWLSLGTWGAAPVATPDISLQGTNDLWGRVTASFGMSLAAVSSVDMTTGGIHLFHFQKNICWPKAAIKSQGGMRLSISSDTTPTLSGSNPNAGPTNSKSWYMGGSDTDFTTGWVCYVIDPTSTPDLTIGTCTVNSVKRAGVGAYITGSVGGGAVKPMNINWSAIRYGTGLTIKDGAGSAPADFPAVYATDSSNSNSWGIITAEGGIYYLAGKINIGTTSQTAVTVFCDTGQTLVFRNFPVNASFYELLVKGAASYKTTFRLGNYNPATGLASSGCTIKGSGNLSGTTHSLWTLTASDSNQVMKFYASTFSEMKSAALAYNAVSIELTGNCTTNTTTTLVTSGSYDTSGIVVGMKVTGTNIASDTYVSSIESATSLTMNIAATGSGSSLTMTFTHNNEMRGCTFSNSGTITTNGCVIDNCIFQDVKTGAPISATYALIVNSATEAGRITNSKFINCNRAIKITAAGTYDFTNLTFSGNSYDIENSSAGAVIINNLGTSNAATYINTGGGTTTINTSVNLTLTVKDTAGTVIQSARAFIRKTAQVAMQGAVADDGGIETDETTASNNATANDMTLLPVVPVTGDAYNFGAKNPFWKLILNIGTPGVGTWTIAWQYWNGAWTTIPSAGFSDGTNAFKASAGNRDVVFTPPSDWTTKTIQGISGYFIRAVVAFTGITTQPKGTQAWVWEQLMNTTTNASGVATTTYNYLGDVAITYDVRKSSTGATKYIPVTGTGTIATTGFSATVTMTTDDIAEA